ncbi:MAG: metallophosphoesterase [Phycisphaerae bacterium]|nr:metallophosphoesterase [Phycisphaerae bacterium]
MYYFFYILLFGLLSMSYYVLWRSVGFFNIKRRYLFHFAWLMLSVSYIAGAILNKVYGGLFGRCCEKAGALWFGILLISITVLVAYEVIKYFFPKTKRKFVGKMGVIVIVVLSIYAYWHDSQLKVKTYQFNCDNEMTIVQISDTHIGTIAYKRFEKIVDLTIQQNPDVVVITGDMFDHGPEDELLEIAKLIDSIEVPVYMVYGNHDKYVDRRVLNKDDNTNEMPLVQKILSQTKVKVLINETIDFNGVQFIGGYSPLWSAPLDKTFDIVKVDREKYNILLYHWPTDTQLAADSGIDLMLTGHTHGGQVIPFGLAVFAFFDHIYGLHKIDDMNLIVSSGAGYWAPPMRLGSDSEIVVIKLGKDK